LTIRIVNWYAGHEAANKSYAEGQVLSGWGKLAPGWSMGSGVATLALLYTRESQSWKESYTMKQIRNTLLRMADRLFLVTIIAGMGRVVAGGELTITAVVAMLVAVILIAALLIAAYRIK
jgi:hypothetical protein